MTNNQDFEEANKVKEHMDHIYDQIDPRAYFRELKSVDYKIPGEAKPIFRDLISLIQESTDDTVRVLDIGCSYGINAALMKHDLSIDDLYDHWTKSQLASDTPEEVIQKDKRFFASLEDAEDIEVIGLDVAENALEFAEEMGLLDEGLSLNLEKEALPETVKEELAPVDLVTSTGCVGYVSETSFNQLLPAVTQERPAWFANFVLRMYPFDTIETALAEHGYVTEKLEGQTFIQREFSSAEEREQVLSTLQDRGLDPTGLEAEGHLIAEFFLSRPQNEAAKLPINEIFAAHQ